MSGPFNGSKTPAEQSAIAAHTDALFYREDPDKTNPNPPKIKNRKTVKRISKFNCANINFSHSINDYSKKEC